jgi:hypothetical protein
MSLAATRVRVGKSQDRCEAGLAARGAVTASQGKRAPADPKRMQLDYPLLRVRQANLTYPVAGQEPRRAVGLQQRTAT